MRNQRPLFLLSSLFAATVFHLQLISTVGDSDSGSATNGTDFIRTSCGATLYPETCYTSLSPYANDTQNDPARLARAAIAVSLSKASHVAHYVSNLSRQASPSAASEKGAAAALRDCSAVFDDAVDQIRGSLKQMRRLGARGAAESFRFQMSNVQTWMSAALTNEDTCTDGFEEVPSGDVKTDVCDRVVKVREVTSNALALVNRYVDKVTRT